MPKERVNRFKQANRRRHRSPPAPMLQQMNQFDGSVTRRPTARSPRQSTFSVSALLPRFCP